MHAHAREEDAHGRTRAACASTRSSAACASHRLRKTPDTTRAAASVRCGCVARLPCLPTPVTFHAPAGRGSCGGHPSSHTSTYLQTGPRRVREGGRRREKAGEGERRREKAGERGEGSARTTARARMARGPPLAPSSQTTARRRTTAPAVGSTPPVARTQRVAAMSVVWPAHWALETHWGLWVRGKGTGICGGRCVCGAARHRRVADHRS